MGAEYEYRKVPEGRWLGKSESLVNVMETFPSCCNLSLLSKPFQDARSGVDGEVY